MVVMHNFFHRCPDFQMFQCHKDCVEMDEGDLLPNLKVVSEEQVLSTSQPEKQHRIARLPPHGPFN